MHAPKHHKNSIILVQSPLHWVISSFPLYQHFPRNSHHFSSINISRLTLFFSFSLLAASTLIALLPFSKNSPPCYHRTSRTLMESLQKHNTRTSTDQPNLKPLPLHEVSINASDKEREFWQQPNGEGYKPCLQFSLKYKKHSKRISAGTNRFLMVVVSGGLNQQKTQIIDAVVIARILQASLVVPVLQISPIWNDESEFSDIFDVEHFKNTLRNDVRVVYSLPSTHLIHRNKVSQNRIPKNVSPIWIIARFSRQLEEDGVLELKGITLSKNLPPDLQKLKCKVAFHALRFTSAIENLGNQLATRMWIEGPYVAVHARLERDAWAKSGCLTGLGHPFDDTIANLSRSHAEYAPTRSNMSHSQRRLAGLCPLTAMQIARLLKGLGAGPNTRIYLAGGEPFGGQRALEGLRREYPNLVTKEMVSKEGELGTYVGKASVSAAVDFIVSLSSEVYVHSHGGSMDRLMQGHRVYEGHRKYIRPNKGTLVGLLDSNVTGENLDVMLREVHKKAHGQPQPRDVNALTFPVRYCMCKTKRCVF